MPFNNRLVNWVTIYSELSTSSNNLKKYLENPNFAIITCKAELFNLQNHHAYRSSGVGGQGNKNKNKKK